VAGQAAGRWHVLAAGFAANAAFSAAISGLPAAAVLLRSQYVLSTGDLGIAFSAVGLGIALSELPWGMVTDRAGDRSVLLAGLGLTAAVLLWMAAFVSPSAAHLPSLAHLVTCMALLGLAGGSLNGSSGRAVMAWFSEAERGLAMGIRQTALPVGGAVGALAVPAAARACGFAPVFAGLALCCLMAAVYCWHCVRPAAAASIPLAQRPGESAPRIPFDRRVWRIALGIGALCVGQIAVLNFMAVFLHDLARLGVVATSAWMATYQVAAAALRIGSGAWTDRRRNRPAFLRTCSAVSGAVFVILAGLSALLAARPASTLAMHAGVACLVLAGTVASGWHGVAFTELATSAGPARVGTALGLGNTLAFGAYFLTPLAVPLALAMAGWPAAWLLVALCAAAAMRLFPGPAARAGAPAASRSARA
jgi:sugar phosphate permease